MGKPRAGQDVQNFRALTERIKNRRQQIRPDYVPELVAWLCLMGERYTRSRVNLERDHRGTSDDKVSGMVQQLKAYESVIQQLCNVVADPWSVFEWEDMTTRIAERFGIVIGQDVPPTVRQNVPVVAAEMAPVAPIPAKG